jgi:hypothetical protein
LRGIQAFLLKSASVELAPGIDATSDGMPEPGRTIPLNKRQFLPEFLRTDPLFSPLLPTFGMSQDDIDAM